MRNRNQKGFTLIELLIVIAIIGILAAVLIPNLLSARASAQDRSVQAFGSQVYTAIQAAIADSTQFDLANDIPDLCNGEVGYSISSTSDGGQVRTFTAPAAGQALSGCSITSDATSFSVTVSSVNGASFTFSATN